MPGRSRGLQPQEHDKRHERVVAEKAPCVMAEKGYSRLFLLIREAALSQGSTHCVPCSPGLSDVGELPQEQMEPLVAPRPLVWLELEVVLVVSDPETCWVTGITGCDRSGPRCAFKWLVKRFQNVGRAELVSVLQVPHQQACKCGRSATGLLGLGVLVALAGRAPPPHDITAQLWACGSGDSSATWCPAPLGCVHRAHLGLERTCAQSNQGSGEAAFPPTSSVLPCP